MRKHVLILGIILLMLFSPNVTFAADALYRMLHADEVDQFKEDQDALIVGQLIDKQGNSFKVTVLKVLSGNVSSNSILVSDNFTYGWDKETPSVNDFCVFSLKKSGTIYKKAWGIFEATSGDYQTLTLKPLNAPTPGLLGDLAAIQWYVNTGGTEKDFFFTNSTAHVRRPNGQIVQIYPAPNQGEDAKVYENALSEIRNSPPASDNIHTNTFTSVLLIIMGLIGVGLFAYIKSRKKIN